MNRTITKRICIFTLVVSSCAMNAFAQGGQAGQTIAIGQNPGPGPVTINVGGFGAGFGATVQGAPYSATVSNESVQTLADGNRIVQSSTGAIARDSQGRTRQDTMLPPIGSSLGRQCRLISFTHHPVARHSYTLNLTDKTAQKMPVPPLPPMPPPGAPGPGPDAFYVQAGGRGCRFRPVASAPDDCAEGIPATLDPKTLQDTWVAGGRTRRFGPTQGAPSSRRTVMVTVTLPSGESVEGRLVRIDDFLVTVALADGTLRTFRREGDVPKVDVHDPMKPHRDLLAVYTDKDIHDVTAYLVTLK